MRMLLAAVTAGLVGISAGMADAPPPPRPPEPKTFCSEQYQPVCGTKDGNRVTYSNRCFATVAGAADIADGPCVVSK